MYFILKTQKANRYNLIEIIPKFHSRKDFDKGALTKLAAFLIANKLF